MAQIVINAKPVTIDQIIEFYNQPVKVTISDASHQLITVSADIINRAYKSSQPIYGVNTGFGKLANTRIETNDAGDLQYNLILSHCCGVGEPLGADTTRLIIWLKLLSFAKGASGIANDVVTMLVELLNRNCLPLIPAQGSVGASGDLAPLAHLAAVLIGHGEAVVKREGTADERMSGDAALKAVGLVPVKLGAKAGLALINGTQVSTALALTSLIRTQRLIALATVIGAMTVDAAMGSTVPFTPEIHQLRGQPGQIKIASWLISLLAGSPIAACHRSASVDERVQDPYCLRCQPQVIGACLDLLTQATNTLVTEANAVTDNPLVLVDKDEIVSGGNFHAEPVAFAADQIAIAIAEIGAIAQRRIALMVDPNLNYGLPPFLAHEPGLNSGFMIAEVTAAALMSENKHLAHPCSIDSTPTSANQEDHVSMATHGAYRLKRMCDNLTNILAIELLIAVQGIELRAPLRTSGSLLKVMGIVRREIPSLKGDRFMAADINRASRLLNDDAILRAVNLDALSLFKNSD